MRITKRWLPKWFPYSGITLYPFVLFKKGARLRIQDRMHEEIHIAQEKEMLVIFFFIWYGIEFIVRRFQYNSWSSAYRNISFEREAYLNQENYTYLLTRRFWGFLKYLKDGKSTL